MRILFAIPHYFSQSLAGHYGSERSAPEARALATRLCLAALRQNFSEAQGLIDGLQSQIRAANPDLSATITIALCTTGDSHLVAHLVGCGFDHVRTQADPRLLGFECHKVLRGGLGQYDYFAYLEDDLRIGDALFFTKLAWFNAQFGEAAVLQPNRFELVAEPAPYKLYIDGTPHDPRLGAGLQRVDDGLLRPPRKRGDPRHHAPFPRLQAGPGKRRLSGDRASRSALSRPAVDPHRRRARRLAMGVRFPPLAVGAGL